jgi:hypothetical protein
MKEKEALRSNVPTQSQAAPDLWFGMSGLVAFGFSTNERASISSLAFA